MKLFLISLIFINIIMLAILIIGYIFEFKKDINPKHKASIGVLMAIFMALYITGFGIFGIINLFINKILLAFLMFFFIALPFVIGYLVKYDTLKKYSIWQIICFLSSLAVLIRLY
ncbi:MAG: hypothetical protein MJ180_02020 [Candidatus Gastranaerophilales bacterium]|nr:hypothetical protein [Candidatus Gastranaerophilales bacterium]